MPERGQRIIASFSKPCSGAGAPDRHGATSRPHLETGTLKFRRFRRGARAGVFERPFKAISGDLDLEQKLIDGAIVSVRRKATGAKGGHGIRPSGARGDPMTRIVALVDALGNLTGFPLLPGQAHDMRGAASLMQGGPDGALQTRHLM